MQPLHDLLSTLSPDQKMDLADMLYDSAQQEMEVATVPLTAGQLAEIDRRCAAVDAGELATQEWPVVHEKLLRES
jgi:putative addiction module component (TIGR02574 family)